MVAFIRDHHGDKSVSLGWFGGEPLVGWKRIDQICKGLQACEVDYSSDMITNGFLFDEEMVLKAKELWKVKSLQITLDGPESVYNRVKAYVSAEGSPYQRVLNNIDLLLKAGISVSIRMNMDKHNHEELAVLIDELAERFAGREGFSAYVAVLFEGSGFEPISRDDGDGARLEEWQQVLQQKLRDNGMRGSRKKLSSLKSRFCMADRDGSVIVMPDGNFQKCEHCLNEPTLGNLAQGWTNPERVAEYKRPITLKNCKNCALEPDCYHIACCHEQNHCTVRERKERLENVTSSMEYYYADWKKKTENGLQDEVDYGEKNVITC